MTARLAQIEGNDMQEPKQLKITVNGKSHTETIEPDMPLLWFLRDFLKASEVKFGCGIARCGACTVHLDGKAVRSCVTPVGDCENKQIVTLRGLGDGGLSSVVKAWIDHQVPQCGYCQPGQMMSAAALLNAKKNPSDQEIDAAMSGNLCRCGTYPKIKKAIQSLRE
jgi:isoquinoline 1-oxidoreductase subunit alpha